MNEPTSCDLVIRNGSVVTMNAERTIIPDGAVAVSGHSIVAVGTTAEIMRDFAGADEIDADGAIVHPGFVESHLHINAQTCRGFFRGDASKADGGGANYADWKACLTEEDEAAAAGLASIEMLRHGITAFVEPGSVFEPDAVAEVTQAVGIRCSLSDAYLWDTTEVMETIPGLASQSLFARVAPDHNRCVKEMGGQLFRNRDPDGIMHGHIALYGEGTASDELYVIAKQAADEAGVILNSHIGFDLDLAAAMERVWGRPRFVHLEAIGALGPNTTFVHMNLIREEDVSPILDSGLSIVWCPLAYVSRGTPLREPTRIPEMKYKGVNIGLGTDSARQSSAGDSGFLALQLTGGAGHPLVSEDVFEMMTLGGAQAAGLDHLIGSLEPGKRADIVIRRTDAAEMMPCIDPIHQMVTVGHGPNAQTVLVNGRIVLKDGRATRIDEAAVFDRAQASVRAIVARLDLAMPGSWPYTTGV